MYLYTRRTRLAPGHGTAGVDWARSVAVKAYEVTGHELHVWGTVHSPGTGTIRWTGRFESLDALEQVSDRLAADPAMEKLTNAGARYLDGGFDDGLLEPIVGTLPPADARYVSVAAAVAVAGSCAQATAAGVAIAEWSEAVIGLPTTFCRSVTGRSGEVSWLTGYDSAAELEAAQRRLAGDRGWLELLASTSGCFVADVGMQTTIHRRLG